MTTQSTPPLRIAWLVWSLGALLYLMGFFQRVAPAVMTDELMRTFSINAAGLGSLSALYFYSYVAMQIPTGILADRWGPRRLLTLGTLIAAIGAVMFALAPDFAWAAAGRLLIGGSVAVAFVCLLKVAGNTVVGHILDMMEEITTEEVIFVVGYKGDQIEAWIRENYPQLDTYFIIQEEALGQARGR